MLSYVFFVGSLLVFTPLITFALDIHAPPQVASPGIMQINVTGQAMATDPATGKLAYAYYTLYNTLDGQSADIVNPETSDNDTATRTVSLSIPLVANGDGWTVVANVGSDAFLQPVNIGTSNTFFIQSNSTAPHLNNGPTQGQASFAIAEPYRISPYAIGGGVFGILALLLGVLRLVLFCSARRRREPENGGAKLEAGQGRIDAPWTADHSTSLSLQDSLDQKAPLPPNPNPKSE